MDPDISSPGHEPRRILVRGVNWLGDAVMTLPALERLCERFPQAEITLFTPQKLSDLWTACPSVKRTLTFAPGENLLSIGRRLRRESFDTALVLPNSPRSALEAWLARIPRRIGYARAWRRWFLTNALSPRAGCVRMRKRSSGEVKKLIQDGKPNEPRGSQRPGSYGSQAHHLNHYLHLVAALGADPEPLAPRLQIESGEAEAAEAALTSRLREVPGHSATPAAAVFFGMNPSAAYGPAKRWPAENFAAVARAVSQKLRDVVWLILGETRDRSLCDQIAMQAGVRFLNLAGRTSLRELLGFLKVCRLLLTNDSGPMHLAAALGTPVVVPFGSTSAELTGPGLPGDAHHRLLSAHASCSPCFRRTCPIDFRCMTGITVEQGVGAVLETAERRGAEKG